MLAEIRLPEQSRKVVTQDTRTGRVLKQVVIATEAILAYYTESILVDESTINTNVDIYSFVKP